MSTDKRYRLGVDIGGTFTDLVIVDEESGRVWSEKVLTTSEDPAQCVITGLSRLMQNHGFRGSEVVRVIHATTLVTNAIIERKGAKTGLITTRGFRDILGIGREIRFDLYDLFLEIPEPLVPRHLIKEVEERVNNEGQVLVPLEAEQVSSVARELVAQGVEAIAVCFLHSFMYPEHEALVETLLKQEYPDLFVSLSSRVAGEIREFERFSTAAANAYVQPMTQTYLRNLQSRLRDRGFECPLHLMLSNGGIASLSMVQDFPVRLIESGPAAAALAASFYGSLAAQEDVIAFDMGGTTAKICLIQGGEPGITYTFEVARTWRFRKGSGLPIKAPALDLIEIGAGGGSIAYLDNLGLLKVGPESTGADPGPICYSRGGKDPTVTDAALLLGYLNPDYFLGGEMPLDLDITRKIIQKRLAEPMGLEVLRTAWGIHDLVCENMASATRIHLAEKGEDPRKYCLVATGGAGPLHAYHVARKLDIPRIICPLGAGVASCIGMLVAPPKMDFVQSYPMKLETIDWGRLTQLYTQMEAEAKERLAEVGVSAEQVALTRIADMRYVGQGHEVAVRLPDEDLHPKQLTWIREAFNQSYRNTLGSLIPEAPIEVLNWRLLAQDPTRSSELDLGWRATEGSGSPLKGQRLVYFAEYGERREVSVYDRYLLPSSKTYHGPAIVEERECTTVVGPRASFYIDSHGNLVMELET